MKKKFLLPVILIIAVAMAISCQSKWKVYTTASYSLYEMTSTYNRVFDFQDDATKTKWADEISPIVIEANDAMYAWRDALVLDPNSASAKYDYYLKVKTKLLELLVKYDII